MAVDGGEVAAVLRLKYISDAKAQVLTDINEIKAKLAELQQANANAVLPEFKDLTGSQIDDMSKKLQGLKDTYEKLAESTGKVAGATEKTSGALGNLEEPTRKVEDEFSKFDGVAERMFFRLTLLYGLREGFDFVKGIFDGASATVELNEQLGYSVEFLQRLQATGDMVDVPFNKITQGIDSLNRNLGEMKSSSLSALNDLGLDFDQIMSMNPDQRFEAIADAIAKISDPTQRAKEEFALFGTDGIDPLIRNFEKLKATAEKAITPEQVERNLAETKSLYAQFGNDITASMSKFFDTAQKIAAVGDLISTGQIKNISDLKEQWQLLDAPVEKQVEAQQTLLTMSDKLSAILEKHKDDTKALTDEQKQSMDVLHQAGLDEEKYAQELGLTVEQYKNYEKGVRASDEAVKKFEETQKRQADQAERDAERQQKAWENAEARIAALREQEVKSEADLEKTRLEDGDKIAKQRMQEDETEAQLRLQQGKETETQYWEEISSIEYHYYQQHEVLLQQEHDQDLAVLAAAHDKELAKIQSDYDKKLMTDIQYQEAKKAIDEKYANQVASSDDKYNTERQIRRNAVLDQMRQDEQNAASNTLTSWMDTFKKMDEEFDKEEQAADKLMKDSTVEVGVSASNLAGALGGFGLGADIGSAEQLASEGYSFAEILNILRGGAKHKPAGPRIPGFAAGIESFAGGEAIVGEQGPERVKLPGGSSVTPTDKLGSEKIVIHNHFHGTPESMTRDVEGRMIASLRTSRLLPAAG